MFTLHSFAVDFNSTRALIMKGQSEDHDSMSNFLSLKVTNNRKTLGIQRNLFHKIYSMLLLLLKVIVRYLWNWISRTWVDWWVENFKESVLDRELDYREWNDSAFPQEFHWCVNVLGKISFERYTNQGTENSKGTESVGMAVRGVFHSFVSSSCKHRHLQLNFSYDFFFCNKMHLSFANTNYIRSPIL